MAQFKYTLPSGAKFTMNAPDGTTQAQADKIFYEQVAAGTFVGYKKGDTLTHPAEAINNLGISRLERGTAGVDDKTLLAIAAMSPVTTVMPVLSSTQVTNPVTTADYVQVTSDPTLGVFSQKPPAIGDLSSEQTQAIMAGLSNSVGQAYNQITQQYGVGKYGFNAQQLEKAGYIKPGYAQMYCPINKNTLANPANFVSFMNSPTPWTGMDNVFSVNDILKNPALQNKIQQKLMSNSYDTFVATGVIVPSVAQVTTPSVSTGKVYTNNGEMSSATHIDILAAPIVPAATAPLATANTLGSIPVEISNLGAESVSQYQAGLSTLTNGAINLTPGIAATGSQLGGLSAGTIGSIAVVAASLTSTFKGDVGALLANGSKFGDKLTSMWAEGTPSLTDIGGSIQGALNKAGDFASGALDKLSNLNGDSLNGITLPAMDQLGKLSQMSVNFSDFNLSGLVAGVVPAAGFSNTVDRKTIDAALTRVIGSEKISTPTYELPSVESLGAAADVETAKKLLSSQKNFGGISSVNTTSLSAFGVTPFNG